MGIVTGAIIAGMFSLWLCWNLWVKPAQGEQPSACSVGCGYLMLILGLLFLGPLGWIAAILLLLGTIFGPKDAGPPKS